MSIYWKKLEAAGKFGALWSGDEQTAAPETGTETTETAETAEPAAAEPTTKTEPHISLSVFNKRVGALTRQKAALELQLQEALAARQSANEQELPASPPERPATASDVEARAAQLAYERDFTRRCNELATRGRAAHGEAEFNSAINLMNASVGQLPPAFLEAVLEMDEDVNSDVLMELSKDLSRVQELIDMHPARLGTALNKLGNKIRGEKAAKTVKEKEKVVEDAVDKKKVSSAPEPITPKVGGSGGKSSKSLDDDNLSTAEWMKLRKESLPPTRRQRA